MKGSDFVKNVIWKDVDVSREAEIFKAITEGNTPAFMRTFVNIELKKGIHFHPMTFEQEDVKAVICQVTSDYLSVGDDADYVRMPMRPATAQKIADKLGCLLPTRKLVDALESQTTCKKAKNIGLNASKVPAATKAKHAGKPDGDWLAFQEFMHTSEAYLVHNAQINDGELNGVSPGSLVSGHKKDIVIPAIAGKVVIYDWPANGRRSVHGAHGSFYVDYSHGVRLVKNSITLDFGSWGDSISFAAALAHPVLHKAFADAPILLPKYHTDK